MLCLRRDDGRGATPEKVAASDGLGLRLVERRLAMRYDGGASCEIETTPERDSS